MLPATYGLDATRALVMLAGIYYGAMYGGSTAVGAVLAIVALRPFITRSFDWRSRRPAETEG